MDGKISSMKWTYKLYVAWIVYSKIVVYAEGASCSAGQAVPKDCEYGCCVHDDGTEECCEKTFWTWGIILAVVAGAVFGIVAIVIVILMCMYCNNKKTHSTRLRHTVSMRSNRIWPIHDLPTYDELADTHSPEVSGVLPSHEDPPRYEEVLSMDRTNNMPQPILSDSEPVVSKTVTVQYQT